MYLLQLARKHRILLGCIAMAIILGRVGAGDFEDAKLAEIDHCQRLADNLPVANPDLDLDCEEILK